MRRMERKKERERERKKEERGGMGAKESQIKRQLAPRQVQLHLSRRETQSEYASVCRPHDSKTSMRM